jgi:hypothetical protein
VTEWHTGRARITGRRLTVSQAADALGVTPEAIRGRIRRGTIRVEREAGRVYVVLDADQPRPTTGQPTDRTEQLIATLLEQLEAEREANRENRRIIAALTSRIPELEAPRETASEKPSEAPAVAADEQQGRGPLTHDEGASTEPTEVLGGPQSGTARGSWWRRMFGG